MAPVEMLFDFESQTHWLTYLGTTLFAAAYYAYRRRGKSLRLKAMVRYVFPRKLFRHPSSILDLKLVILGAFYVFLQAGLLVSFSNILNAYMSDAITYLSGAQSPVYTETPLWVMLILPIVIFLVFELGYWFCHYLMHISPLLWEFHKVHHSAEVMTPLTEFRQHPVELFLFPFIISLTLSILYGVVFWLYGTDVSLFAYWNMGIIVIVFFSTIGHLRHSHVDFSMTGVGAYLFQTPAHHHIHHSMERRHFDKNMGFCLSVWDYVFGTLYVPEKNQKIRFGIDDGLTRNYSLMAHLIEPFRQAIMIVTRRKKPFSPTVFSQKKDKM